MPKSTKTYGHDRGFSCAFRQPKAHSHCRHLHGYSLGFKFTFASNVLDPLTGWVVDFGGLKGLKDILERTFDHTTILAENDPLLGLFKCVEAQDGARLVVLPAVGCEAFAKYVYLAAEQWLKDAGFTHCWLESVEVSEHGANSAIYTKDDFYAEAN